MSDNRIALITGANKGIGFEAARQLGKLGIRVLIGARDPARGQTAAATLSAEGVAARAVTIDVSDQASIAAAAQEIAAQEGKLDILVNNAGIGLERLPPSEMDITRLREILETNFFGVIATTQAFLPLVRQAPAGRIVNVSSSLGSLLHLSDPEWVAFGAQFTAYSISKTALNSWTAILSSELHGSTTKVNAVEPGFTATDMTAGQGFQTTEEAARVIVKYATMGPEGPNGGYFDIHGRLPW
jgi:NAD(P)-dependent dehydrogenase (short-subunit alcohol dehydrogenase family)